MNTHLLFWKGRSMFNSLNLYLWPLSFPSTYQLLICCAICCPRHWRSHLFRFAGTACVYMLLIPNCCSVEGINSARCRCPWLMFGSEEPCLLPHHSNPLPVKITCLFRAAWLAAQNMFLLKEWTRPSMKNVTKSTGPNTKQIYVVNYGGE